MVFEKQVVIRANRLELEPPGYSTTPHQSGFSAPLIGHMSYDFMHHYSSWCRLYEVCLVWFWQDRHAFCIVVKNFLDAF